jgi:hypothetical protein
MKILLEIMLVFVILPGNNSIALSQKAQPMPCPEGNYHQREPNLGTWYEPQQNRTTVVLNLPRPLCRDDYDMRISFGHSGRELKAPNTVSLLFMQIPPFADDRFNLTVVLDNSERLPLGKLTGTGMHVTLSGVDMYVALPLKTFLGIARAKKVQIIVGRKKFELSEKYIEAIRQLGARIEGAA